jgi:hypothetical protein
MTVVQGRLLGLPFAQDSRGEPGNSGQGEPWPVSEDGTSKELDETMVKSFFFGNSLNSTAYETTSDEGEVIFIGSKTECKRCHALLLALAHFVTAFGTLCHRLCHHLSLCH